MACIRKIHLLHHGMHSAEYVEGEKKKKNLPSGWKFWKQYYVIKHKRKNKSENILVYHLMGPTQPKFFLYEYNVLNKDLLSSAFGHHVPSLQKL